MSKKGQRKSDKKAPAKTLKEKRAAKAAKQAEKKSPPLLPESLASNYHNKK